MNTTLQKAGAIAKKIVLNKYLLTLLLFAVWMLFFDEHNFIKLLRTKHKNERLEREIEHYKQITADDKAKIQDLNSGDENLEKFAREHYYMKRDDEDIFLIEEK